LTVVRACGETCVCCCFVELSVLGGESCEVFERLVTSIPTATATLLGSECLSPLFNEDFASAATDFAHLPNLKGQVPVNFIKIRCSVRIHRRNRLPSLR